VDAPRPRQHCPCRAKTRSVIGNLPEGVTRLVRLRRKGRGLTETEEGDLCELYDFVDDPKETTNLFPELAGEAAKLQPLLEAWMEHVPLRVSELPARRVSRGWSGPRSSN